MEKSKGKSRGKSREELAKISKKTQFKAGKQQVETARMGGHASQKVQHQKKDLKTIFETLGDSTPLEVVQERLKAIGFDVSDMTYIEALVKIASIKTLDSTSTVNDLLKFIDMFAKFTGQEPITKTELTGSLGLKKVFVTKEQKKAVEEHIADVVGKHR